MTKWEQEVKKDYDEIIKANKLVKVNFNTWKTSLFLAITFIVLSITSFSMTGYFYIITSFNPIAIAIGIIISIVFLFLMVLIFKARSKLSKIKYKIINSLNFPYYYSLALKQFSNDKYHLSSLSTMFVNAPINFLPKTGNSKTDEVLNFVGNNINYNMIKKKEK